VLKRTASDAARLTGISTRSVNTIFLKTRQRIAQYCEAQSPYSGETELDESYFSPKRIQGKHGRAAGSKTIVFSVFKRNGHVYTVIVPDSKKKTLLAVIRGRIDLDSVIHTDGWRAHDGLVDLCYEKHFRVHHGANEFAAADRHINDIESFWDYAKLRLSRFKGSPKHTFYLHLKEPDFRFNHRREDLYKRLLKLLWEHPI
jgi:transposase-like protein